MKKALCIVVCFVIIASLAACSSQNIIAQNSHYSVEMDGEKTYLLLKTRGTSSSQQNTIVAAPVVYFSSVAEMKSDILNGKFSESELKEIQRFSVNDAGKTEICNVQKLYEPVLPSDWKLEKVRWSGRYYNFLIGPIKDIEDISNNVYIRSKDYFSDLLAEYEKTQGNSERIEDRNAVVYSYRSEYADWDTKRIKYELVVNSGKTIYVDEYYYSNVSATVPEYILLYIDDNGKYLEIYLDELGSRPSVEWLSQFGIREYVETEVS